MEKDIQPNVLLKCSHCGAFFGDRKGYNAHMRKERKHSYERVSTQLAVQFASYDENRKVKPQVKVTVRVYPEDSKVKLRNFKKLAPWVEQFRFSWESQVHSDSRDDVQTQIERARQGIRKELVELKDAITKIDASRIKVHYEKE